ncbi:MAG: DUF5667 domain-containing protein [Candidatus Dormibacteraeota bacterium]|nr:DUF5667 domain-containing protein [Candidatus Dormibacteraeota bacterium]
MDEIKQITDRLGAVARVRPSTARVEHIRMAIWQPITGPRAVVGPAPRFPAWRRPAYALAFALALLALGTTSVFASGDALPDSPLYRVRNLREDVQVNLMASPAARAALYATFASERSVQLRAVVHGSQERAGVVGTLLRDIADRIHHANQEASKDGPESRASVREVDQQIGQELTQLQQEGEFTGNNSQAVSETLAALAGDRSGNGDTNQDGNQQ